MQELASLRKGNAGANAERLRAALKHWRASGWQALLSGSDFAQSVMSTKDVAEILGTVDEELERIESHQVFSIFPETLRTKGELLLLLGESKRSLAHELFLRSLDPDILAIMKKGEELNPLSEFAEAARKMEFVLLQATMGISARATSLADRPQWAIGVTSARTRRAGRSSISFEPLADLDVSVSLSP